MWMGSSIIRIVLCAGSKICDFVHSNHIDLHMHPSMRIFNVAEEVLGVDKVKWHDFGCFWSPGPIGYRCGTVQYLYWYLVRTGAWLYGTWYKTSRSTGRVLYLLLPPISSTVP
jgi:hypothetical protein